MATDMERFGKLADAYEDMVSAPTQPTRRQKYERQLPVVPRCKECGLRKRGPNHDEGEEHIRRAGSKKSVA